MRRGDLFRDAFGPLMSPQVHPTAVVEDGATLADDVSIGPFCVVGGQVTLGSGVELKAHAVVGGRTTMGAGCVVYPFASIGMPPQDLKYRGEDTAVFIGSNTIIREHVTVSPGTINGRTETRIGNDCFLMIGSHVAHDCILGDRVILVNNATLGGHVVLGTQVIVGGLAAIHQFVRIGDHAFIGGMAGVEQDVIPFGMVVGERAWLSGLNLVGLKRRGFSREEIRRLRDIYRVVFQEEGALADRLDKLRHTHVDDGVGRILLDFIDLGSDRKILKPKVQDGS